MDSMISVKNRDFYSDRTTSLENSDKRQTVRVASNRPVVMKVNDSTIFATMTDFSKHGLGFIAMYQLDRNETVEVHFDIPFKNGFKSFLFNAHVKHCIDLFDKSHIGVRLDIEENEYSQLFDKIIAT
ncbi:PilZ domain-containing protein [Hydrogenovibrio marinus]|uniref:PilZ domain-containing protein n=1 Tax=Hydrogenovibrio marinus TaxID=28885 RepID=A0A067A005_HYDMR|nr:PilZ domain-containing protein [Hydrogenovibrio marinus]KDN95946.1 hypothetical protein EI16_06560 [Hydrogenovibrio marinus]BBN58562.1 hypothetical protein HVMH_0156 [Hydrogenovibrio marinus]